MTDLKGSIALVAGASRGAGRGIAVTLGACGATVYCAARTTKGGPKPADGAPGTIEETAEEVTARGGRGIPVQVDFSSEAQVVQLFSKIKRLDIAVSSAWFSDPGLWGKKFWELSADVWNDTVKNITASWLFNVHSARLMMRQKRGLIIHVTDNSWDGDRSGIDLGHEFQNRLILSSAGEAKSQKVTILGLNPGFMRTERVRMHMTTTAIKKRFRYDLSESPEYIGRAVAALAADKRIHKRTGELLRVADLAQQYNFTDIDGRYIPVFDPKRPLQAFPD